MNGNKIKRRSINKNRTSPAYLSSSLIASGVILGNDEVKLVKSESFVGLSLILNKTGVHQVQKRLIVHHLPDVPSDLL